MSCSINKITNKINNKIYIGSSVEINKREYKHFWMLNKNIHDNIYLQNSYNKFGRDSFIFEYLEICNSELLVEKENYYISLYNSNNLEFGYNLALVNEFRRNTYNNEVKIKLSKYNLIKNGNFNIFKLINIKTNQEYTFNSLVDGANYLILNGFAKGKPRNVRMCISNCLRGRKLNNGIKTETIRKTCYKHYFKIIN